MTNDKLIYLDNLSTTPVDPIVAEAMQTCLTITGDFGNPSSQHIFGEKARARVEKARSQIAKLIHADPAEIIFTSGTTESINLALKGAALFYQRQGKHIITMNTEHKAVLETCAYLETLGFEVTYLSPEKNGLLLLEKLKATLRHDTILASIMHVNNETGVIQDIFSIGNCLRDKGILFHVDAAQSVGKINIDLKKLPVDLLSLSSHKLYGPKGIAALYVRKQPKVQLITQMHGAEQEGRARSGTLATHQIVGMGEAYALAEERFAEDAKQIQMLRDYLWKKLSALPGIHLNGDEKNRVCGCLNIRVDHVSAEKLLKQLPLIAISTGAACNKVDPEPSHVLLAMGLTRTQANESIRIGIGRLTLSEEIESFIMQFAKAVNSLRML